MTAATAAPAPGPLITGSGSGAVADDTPPRLRPLGTRVRRRYRLLHPIQLRSRTDMIDLVTGELAPLYGQVTVACGNRREAVCPACSAVYKRDARHLVRAGLAGGKGIPETITAHPCVFATFTAPSFGPVHARRLRGKTVLPCRPRRDAKTRRCAHGRDISCPARHAETDPRLGRPMCPDCFNYEMAVLFNAYAARLWQRFTTYVPRHLARLLGITQKHLRSLARLRFVKVAEYQARGVVHFHAVIRLDAPGEDYQPPPTGITAAELCQAIGQAAAAVRLVHRLRRPGRGARLRPQTDTRIIRDGDLNRQAARSPGGGQLHRQVRHQDPRRARPAQPAHPPRSRHRPAPLPSPLPAHGHHRLAARPHRTMPGLGPHARLRRPLPHQIPPLLRHLRPAPHRPHRTPPRHPGPGTRPDAWGRPLDETVVLVLPTIWAYGGQRTAVTPGAELALASADMARGR